MKRLTILLSSIILMVSFTSCQLEEKIDDLQRKEEFSFSDDIIKPILLLELCAQRKHEEFDAARWRRVCINYRINSEYSFTAESYSADSRYNHETLSSGCYNYKDFVDFYFTITSRPQTYSEKYFKERIFINNVRLYSYSILRAEGNRFGSPTILNSELSNGDTITFEISDATEAEYNDFRNNRS